MGKEAQNIRVLEQESFFKIMLIQLEFACSSPEDLVKRQILIQ